MITLPVSHWSGDTEDNSPNVFYMLNHMNGRIYKSVNGGATWISKYTVPGGVDPIVIVGRVFKYLDYDKVYLGAATNSGLRRIITTSNQGENWFLKTAPFEVSGTNTDNTNDTIFIAGPGGDIDVWLSTNMGDSWTKRSPLTGTSFTSPVTISMINNNTGYIILNSGGGYWIYKTTNAWVSVSVIASNLSSLSLPYMLKAISENEMYVYDLVGSTLHLKKSTNQGVNWTSVWSIAFSVFPVERLTIGKDNRYYIDHNGKIYRSDDGNSFSLFYNGANGFDVTSDGRNFITSASSSTTFRLSTNYAKTFIQNTTPFVRANTPMKSIREHN